MTWISLVCLLALSSSAFGRSSYGGGYSGTSVPQISRIFSSMEQPQPFLPTIQTGGYGSSIAVDPVPLTRTLTPQGYGSDNQVVDTTVRTLKFEQPAVQTFPTGGYGSSFEPQPFIRTLVSSGYDNDVRSLDQLPPVQILTPADLLCRGQVAETVIPIEDGRKFVVCTAESKGDELSCPKGLFYHQQSRRCERNLGPLENPCSSQSCLNGGQCIPTDSWYQCQCAPGFDGPTCELDAQYCQQQQPCGSSPDTRCQSFRLGAALQWVCIFQEGLAYGLGATQVQPSPCRGIDGPQALAITDKGFIMCDGERMHVESCPGGTIWDDLNKACTWPDMQGVIGVPQQNGYGQTSSYGQSRAFITKPTYDGGYGAQEEFKPMPKLIQFQPSGGYGGQEQQRLIQVQPSGYGSQQELRPQPVVQFKKLVSGY
jgi:hypothetical protein